MPQEKPTTLADKKKQGGKAPRRPHIRRIITAVCVALLLLGVWQFSMMGAGYPGEDPAWVFIPPGSTKAQIEDSLRSSLGDSFGKKVNSLLFGNPGRGGGAYRVDSGDSAVGVARRIAKGQQTPVKLTFNNIRTVDELASRLSSRMGWSKDDFLKAFAEEAVKQNLTPEQLAGHMIPDTYEVYWTNSPQKIISKILANYERFWTGERREQAKELGLTPDEVSTLASICEEETSRRDERGKIARLYLNRLKKGMRLQSDPTVRYASGDFTVQRIGGKMLDIDSPFNTYRYAGLPPAPIRIPEKRTIEDVLSAPVHDYIYMCARPDFSGYHDFTADYQEHLRNAAAFRRALDARGIAIKE